MKNCDCTKPFYCDQDNLHYPGHTCDACYAQEIEMQEAFHQHEMMIEALAQWSGKSVKPLKPKPKHRVVIEDDLPF